MVFLRTTGAILYLFENQHFETHTLHCSVGQQPRPSPRPPQRFPSCRRRAELTPPILRSLGVLPLSFTYGAARFVDLKRRICRFNSGLVDARLRPVVGVRARVMARFRKCLPYGWRIASKPVGNEPCGRGPASQPIAAPYSQWQSCAPNEDVEIREQRCTTFRDRPFEATGFTYWSLSPHSSQQAHSLPARCRPCHRSSGCRAR